MDATTDERVGQWADALFAAIDAQDAKRFTEFLTEDGEFVFGSAQTVQGRAAVAEAVAGFFASIAGIEHRDLQIWDVPGKRIVEGRVRYTRHDGRDVELPFADVFDMDGELIASYKIYMDIGPLYAD